MTAQLALTPALEALHAAAEEACKLAYAPYGKFAVGAALLCRDGSIVTGGNVENASISLSICAERAAIFRAVAMGHRAFDAVAVAGAAPKVTPCGACRQVLYEFLSPETPIAFPLDGELAVFPLRALMPHAWEPADAQ